MCLFPSQATWMVAGQSAPTGASSVDQNLVASPIEDGVSRIMGFFKKKPKLHSGTNIWYFERSFVFVDFFKNKNRLAFRGLWCFCGSTFFATSSAD